MTSTPDDIEAWLEGKDAPLDDKPSPVIERAARLLDELASARVTSIHLEPSGGEVRVRVRQDGVLRDRERLPRVLARPLAARFKVIARLDICERALPQEGRIELEGPKGRVACRVLTLPCGSEEVIDVFALEPPRTALALSELGLGSDTGRVAVILEGRGLVLVVGPSGSGKRTVVDAFLAHAARPERRAFSIGRGGAPPGTIALEPRPEKDLDVLSLLREAERREANVIALETLRGHDLSERAAVAALDGRLVLAGLPAANARGAIARLQDMGLEPCIIAESLALVVASRLLRRLCARCKVKAPPPYRDVLDRLGAAARTRGAWTEVFSPGGCEACAGTGYSGVVPVFEVLPIEPLLRAELVSTSDDRERALRAGAWRPLREAALEKAREGVTSLAEVARQTPAPG